MFIFPFTNFHELNLDWILSVVKEARDVWTTGEEKINTAVQTAEEAKEIATQAAEAQVADNSVSTAKLQNGAVTTPKIADGGVTTIKIAANAITDAKLQNGAVTTPKIADGGVTTIKIAANAITEDKLSQELRETIHESATKYDQLRIIIVAQDGSGDYTTISDAVNEAETGDIILVYPGTYFESVHAYNKLVHIKGIDKKTCILEYHGRDYANPPLEMAKGSMENLTIIARNSGTAGNYNAYCVHIDDDAEAGQNLYFRNVRFYNEIHQAVGIGLRHNFSLTFDTCEFEAAAHAALYCHDWETSDTSADKSGQKLTLHNCVLRNNDPAHATIMLQSQELATNCATCEFVCCGIANGSSLGKKISMTRWNSRTLTNNSFMGSSDWVLSYNSALNTAAELNNTPYPVGSKDLFFFDNVHYHVLNSETPFITGLRRFKGGLALCNLQGEGFKLLYLYHNNNNVAVVKDVLTGSAFTSNYYNFAASDNDGTLTIYSTVSGNSPILLITPETY